MVELTFLPTSQEQSVTRRWMDDMGAALAIVRIVGPETAAAAGQDHMSAVLDYASVQRKLHAAKTEAEAEPLVARLVAESAKQDATREALLTAIQSALNIKP